MADPAVNGEAEEELVDYEEEEVAADAEAPAKGEPVKKGYVGIHSSGFKDFLLKPELIRAIVDCGFEHPSEGASRTCNGRPQHEGLGNGMHCITTPAAPFRFEREVCRHPHALRQ